LGGAHRPVRRGRLYLADSLFAQKSNVPVRTTLFFFALNFISVSTIIYMLLRLSIAEKRKAQKSLEKPTSSCRSNRSAPKSCCSTSCPHRSPSA
jgi:hypothetical protein